MTSSLVFGETFRLDNSEYVFLTKTPEIWYVAEILNDEKSDSLKRFSEKQVFTNHDVSNKPLLCFVELKTDDYKNRIAHFGNTQKNDISDYISPLNIALCKEDMLDVIETILNGPVPNELKELIKNISIKNN